MLEQADLRDDLARLMAWTAAHPRVAAGVWFDNGPGNAGPVRMGVGVVGDVDSAAAELRALIAHPDRLDVVSKRVPEADLRVVQDRIAAERMRPQAHPTCMVTSVGVDIDAGRVTIGIHPFDADFAAELVAAYGGGEWVLVEARAPVRFLPGIITRADIDGSDGSEGTEA
jgi:hypothetical protein